MTANAQPKKRICTAISNNPGRWFFVGSVPTCLSYVDRETGEPLSAQRMNDAMQFGPTLAKATGRVWPTEAAAYQALVDAGYADLIPEGKQPATLAPATNTEARQLAELDAEQPEALTDEQITAQIKAWNSPPKGYPDNSRLYYTDREKGWSYLTPAGRAIAQANSPAYQAALATYTANVEAWAHDAVNYMLADVTAQTSQPAAQLIDPIATLPLFSQTCPRAADPGRFDPPARSTDVQPALF